MSRKKRQGTRQSQSTSAVTGAELQARRDARMHFQAALKSERTTLTIVNGLAEVEARAHKALAEVMQADPPPTPSACQEGCSWCCYKRVGVSSAEVLAIVEHLKQKLSSEEFQETVQRIKQSAAARKTLPVGERSKAMPCPLLVADRCQAYPVRPFTCRGFNSADADLCRLSLDPRTNAKVPAYVPQQRLFTLVLDGVREALTLAGFEGELLELAAALDAVISNPKAPEDWLAHKPVFTKARMD